MGRVNHKWNGNIKNGAVACLNCQCIREKVNGKYIYFINDNVYTISPDCDKSLFHKTMWDKLAKATKPKTFV